MNTARSVVVLGHPPGIPQQRESVAAACCVGSGRMKRLTMRGIAATVIIANSRKKRLCLLPQLGTKSIKWRRSAASVYFSRWD